MRGYDTLFVQRVKSVKHESRPLRVFVKACLRNPQPIADLAKEFGVARATVYNWLTGQTMPHPRYLAVMLQVADVISAGNLKRK
jgi:transcriptional regulator with XRE-family HTH domain